MNFRISPLWWPLLALTSPVLVMSLLIRNQKYLMHLNSEKEVNQRRMAAAKPLDLPVQNRLDLTVLLEHKALPGFRTAPGISYYLTTDEGGLVFDLGFGDEDPAMAHNLKTLAPDFSQVKGVAISHLHPDHMGGFRAMNKNQVPLPAGFEGLAHLPCYVPDAADSQVFTVCPVKGPGLVTAGIGTTGPLSRSLFLMGPIEEQALLVRLKDKGMVVITGCGHPTIARILAYAKRLCSDPVYAVIGGLHLPVTDSPLRKPGIKVQMIWGTGKPPWQRITDHDVDEAVSALNQAKVRYLFLSSHDICSHAVGRLEREITGTCICLEAGQTYSL